MLIMAKRLLRLIITLPDITNLAPGSTIEVPNPRVEAADRVARCPVFDRTVRFFGDLSGQKMGLSRTMSHLVFRPLLVIYSRMCILAVSLMSLLTKLECLSICLLESSSNCNGFFKIRISLFFQIIVTFHGSAVVYSSSFLLAFPLPNWT